MINLVCFLEESSAREMLKGVLTRLLPNDVECTYIVFDGKQDLEKQLVRKLQNWLKPDSVFLVMRDQDAADCSSVKEQLSSLCREAGRPETLVRIACRELESFYFGDLSAVEAGLGIKSIVNQQQKAKYRIPDDIVNPSRELVKLTNGVYQKVSGSRSIGPLLSLEKNSSLSFNTLITGIRNLFSVQSGVIGLESEIINRSQSCNRRSKYEPFS